MPLSTTPACRPHRCAPPRPDATPHADERPDVIPASQVPLRCAVCLAPVTTASARFLVDGRHVHVCCNPAGLVFEIGCFSSAIGCVVTGAPSREFTWFTGYSWQVALCRCCGQHLGWRFASEAGGFWGLIMDRLR